jgi:hypothetical protein
MWRFLMRLNTIKIGKIEIKIIPPTIKINL